MAGTKAGRAKSLAEQIAGLDDPAPKDFDPEVDEREQHASTGDSDSDGGANDNAAREHYVEVGESKLRHREGVALGPQYAGSRISRDALLDDDDGYDDPFGIDKEDEDQSVQVDQEPSEDEGVEGSADSAGSPAEDGRRRQNKSVGVPLRTYGSVNGRAENSVSGSDLDSSGEDREESSEEASPESAEEMADETSTEDDEDEEDEDESQDDEEEEDSRTRRPAKDAERADLRRMMGEEQTMVATSISEAAKADARKGRAVVQQRKTFDAFLNTRIRLQKGLIATNSLSVGQPPEDTNNAETKQAYVAAEEAALKLWNQLDTLRRSLSKTASPARSTGSKRKFEATTDTPSAAIWEEMQAQHVASLSAQRTTLEKWSSKVHGTNALTATRSRLNPLNSDNRQQPITSVLDSQVADSDRLVSRTRIPRSCAPMQASASSGRTGSKHSTTDDIFDDADFYQLLLKELVDQRSADASSSSGAFSSDAAALDGAAGLSQWSAMREAKTRKKVDTRASKGRKLRYTVHEKLQNFMAPEDRGSWGQRQVDELFGSLLGRRMRLDERDEGGGQDADAGGSSEAEPGEEERLMLFRS